MSASIFKTPPSQFHQFQPLGPQEDNQSNHLGVCRQASASSSCQRPDHGHFSTRPCSLQVKRQISRPRPLILPLAAVLSTPSRPAGANRHWHRHTDAQRIEVREGDLKYLAAKLGPTTGTSSGYRGRLDGHKRREGDTKDSVTAKGQTAEGLRKSPPRWLGRRVGRCDRSIQTTPRISTPPRFIVGWVGQCKRALTCNIDGKHIRMIRDGNFDLMNDQAGEQVYPWRQEIRRDQLFHTSPNMFRVLIAHYGYPRPDRVRAELSEAFSHTVFGYFDHHCEPVLISLRDGHIAFFYPRLASSKYVLVGWAEGDISWSKSESLLGTSSTSATVTATNVSSWMIDWCRSNQLKDCWQGSESRYAHMFESVFTRTMRI